MVSEYKKINRYAKDLVEMVESLDVLEEQLNFTELEQEMGTEIFIGDSFSQIVSYAFYECEIDTLEKFKNHLTSVAHWKVRIFHALQDRKFVLVLS